MIKKSNKAVLLLSGGLDSAVVLSICKKLGYEIDAITFDYNQRHKVELNCAKWQADNFKCVSHRIFKLDFFGGSSLTDNIDVPKNENITNIDSGIPNTYVPSRNIIFLSFASGYAEYKNIDKIFLGVNAVDYSGYPDCRKEFIDGFEKLINFSTKKGLCNKNQFFMYQITPGPRGFMPEPFVSFLKYKNSNSGINRYFVHEVVSGTRTFFSDFSSE